MHHSAVGKQLSYTYRLGENATSPLALFVHGRAGNSEVMWTFRRQVPESWHILAPQADLADPIGGWSWWAVGRGIPKEESYNDARAAWGKVKGLISEFCALHGLNPRFVVGLGFSQGGALLSIPLQEEPGEFRGVALLASLAIRTPKFLSNPTSLLPDVFIGHGENDETVPLAYANKTASLLREGGYRVKFVSDAVGHKVGVAGMRALKEWLTAI